MIIRETEVVNDNIYHFDLHQFGMPYVTSAFYYWDGETCILMDVGTSDDIRKVMRNLRKQKIPWHAVEGIILSHYHFDHGGGSTKIWREMQKKNENFKIYVPEDTFFHLQDAQGHLKGAKTTFGDFVGRMKPAPEEAYEIVEKEKALPFETKDGSKLCLLKTPGHTADHCSPMLEKDGQCRFIFCGEAAGTLFHGSRLVSLPTSMPPHFNYESYMNSLVKIMAQRPMSIGFCHFGAVHDESRKETASFLNEHYKYMKEFRQKVQELYSEEPSTRYVIENMPESMWDDRVDPYFKKFDAALKFFQNLQVAIVYGMMIDLGLRKPKYEQ